MITKSTDEIRARIDKFVQELDLLVRRQTLDALKAVLSGDSPSPRASTSAAPARARRGRRGAALSPETTGQVLASIQGAGEAGISASDIGKALGASSKDLRKVLQGLAAEGQIHTTGQRRGTRYHAGAGGGAKKGRRKA